MAVLNHWADQYASLNERTTIRERVTLRPAPLSEKFLAANEFSADLVFQRLSDCYLPTEADLNFIQQMLSKAQAHAVLQYADDKAFHTNVHAQELELPPARPVMLCGQAGVGKSSVAAAIHRLLASEQRRITVQGFNGDWQLAPFALVRMSGIHSLGDVYRMLADTEALSTAKRNSAGRRMQNFAIRKLYREGCCLLGLDEFQFVTQGLSANALVTKILLGVVYLCVPFFYVCNFSLVNRLLSRNVEDIQRLLADVVVLEPDPPESNDWKMLLAEYQRIGNVVFDFELVEQGSKLWNMCAGIKRHLVVLLSTAYREARSAGRRKVQLQDVSAAYGSVAFGAQRRDVELLISQAIQRKPLRADLWSPIRGQSAHGTKYQDALVHARQAKLASVSINSALTVAEQAALEHMGNAASDTDATATRSTAATKKGKRKMSASDLIAAANNFESSRMKR